MSDYRDAVRTLLEVGLRCPKCGATNRPMATYIELDHESARAYCAVCSRSGPTSLFQPVKEPASS